MHTVVGDYEDGRTAQRAVEALLSRDIPRERIELRSKRGSARKPAHEKSWANDYSDVRRDRDDGFLAGLRHFFVALFGTDVEPQVVAYSEGALRGGTTVTVHAGSREEADRAAEVLRVRAGSPGSETTLE